MLIYKDDQVKEIHPIDFLGWQKEGWASQPTSGQQSTNSDLINLNTATQKELESLETVGKVMGNRIINARPIQSLEDLKAIEGLNVEAIADLITF